MKRPKSQRQVLSRFVTMPYDQRLDTDHMPIFVENDADAFVVWMNSHAALMQRYRASDNGILPIDPCYHRFTSETNEPTKEMDAVLKAITRACTVTKNTKPTIINTNDAITKAKRNGMRSMKGRSPYWDYAMELNGLCYNMVYVSEMAKACRTTIFAAYQCPEKRCLVLAPTNGKSIDKQFAPPDTMGFLLQIIPEPDSKTLKPLCIYKPDEKEEPSK